MKKAEIELRRAVELDPSNPVLLSALGTVLAQQQKLREASAYFNKALKIDSGDLATRRNLAALQWQLGELQQAGANLKLLLKSDASDKRATLLLGLVEENQRNYAKACALLESVPDQVKQHADAIPALANCYYRTSQPARAANALRMLGVPRAPTASLIAGGKIALDASDYQTAEKLFWADNRSDPALDYHRAQLRYRTGRIEESQKILLALTQQQPTNNAAYNLLGWCYQRQGAVKDAVHAFETAISLAPEKEANYLDLATVLSRNGRLLVAQTLAADAVQKFPSSPRIHEMSGLVAASLGQYTDAVRSYARSVQLDPKSPEAHLGLAVSQAEAGMAAEATSTFEQGLKRFPTHAGHYAEYGLMLIKRVDAGEASLEPQAVRLLEKAVALDPTLAEPYYRLGNLALNRKEYDIALQRLNTAAKLSPNASKIHLALSRVFARLGRKQEAVDEQRKFAMLKAEEDEGKSHASVQELRLTEVRPEQR